MATPIDTVATATDLYGATGKYFRENNTPMEMQIAIVRGLTQLETERSQSNSRTEKLLVQREANHMDAAAKAAETLAKMRAARIQGNSDAYNAYAKILVGQMDTLSKTAWDVASREFAPMLIAARQAENQSKGGEGQKAYWGMVGGNLLGQIKTPYGEAYADQLLIKAQEGRPAWRDVLKPGTFEYQQMEDIERVAQENRENRGNAQKWIDDTNLKLGGGGYSTSDLQKMPGEDNALTKAIGKATGGMEIDVLKAQVADMRSTIDDSGLDDTIQMFKAALGGSKVAGENSDYVKTLQNPEFQAWAKDHGFVVGTVKTTADGKFDGVQPGKDDYLAAKGYVYQMKRDPTARQRRWRASHDIVRLDWNEGATEGEKPRDPNDVVWVTRYDVIDAEGKAHSIRHYRTGDSSKEYILDENGAPTTTSGLAAIGKADPNSISTTALSNDAGLAHANIVSDPEKIKQYNEVSEGEVGVRLAAENEKLKKSTNGSPQYAYGVDLGLAGGHGVRVIIDEDGKRRTVPAAAKVTRLESLTPEHVSELDKLRANRVNQAVKRTDALSPQQKEQQLGTLDEPMGLKEKIEEAKKQNAAQRHQERMVENEQELPATDLKDMSRKDVLRQRAIDADPQLLAREQATSDKQAYQAENENDFAPLGVPTPQGVSSPRIEEKHGLTAVPIVNPGSASALMNQEYVRRHGEPIEPETLPFDQPKKPKFSMLDKNPPMDEVGRLQFAARKWHEQRVANYQERQARKEAVPFGAKSVQTIP